MAKEVLSFEVVLKINSAGIVQSAQIDGVVCESTETTLARIRRLPDATAPTAVAFVTTDTLATNATSWLNRLKTEESIP